MYRNTLLAAAALAIPAVLAQDETVLGVYMFHRHGDRTPKVLGHTVLTDLGYLQVFDSGDYYRNRYISSNATSQILGIANDVVSYRQIAASAPANDVVLQNSATGFLQGLYPPVGDQLSTQTLRNGTQVTAPMQGYQLIPVGEVSTGAGSENNAWLQDATDCANAELSSNQFFSSQEYMNLLNTTQDFYNNLLPVVNSTFNASQNTFKNAYTIWDYVNVALIHNETIPSSDLLTDDVVLQLETLAFAHEWGLAYNSSNEIRAIAGMTLGEEIMDFFNTSISTQGSQKINIQFGAYGTFAAFFGLAGLANVNVNFTGVTDYASSMAFELFTNGSATSYPEDEIALYVRFLYHNGTASESSPPAVYPLFGSGQQDLSWSDFRDGMNRFALNDQESWCSACGNTTGTCAAYSASDASGNSSTGSSSSGGHGGNGLSPAVNGVIGAFVTLAVLLLISCAVLLLGGFRLVNKKRLAQVPAGTVTETKA